MSKWTLTNEQYDIFKWLISVVIPAVVVFLGTVMSVLNWQHTQNFVLIAGAFELLLGTVFKVSDINYNKEEE